jgi:integration host factor subunit beta
MIGCPFSVMMMGSVMKFPSWRVGCMTKAELVDQVADKVDLTKKQTEVIVNILFNSITDALSQGDKVELRGFGSFRIRRRNPREGRNPKTGDAVHIPAKRVPFFKAGKELREMVDNP